MVLHLGEDTVVSLENIIAIIDRNTFYESPENNYLLKSCKEEGSFKYISDKPPKSFIITEMDDKTFIYLSPISSRTLVKRRDFLGDITAKRYKARGKK